MSGIVWVSIVLLLSLTVLILEMFIPSGGILGIISAIGFLTSIVLAFQSFGQVFGLLYLVGLAIGLPFVFWGMIKYWPHTALGRMMLNLPPPGTESEPIHNPLEDLIGKKGTAKSKMLPSGAVVIEGRTYDAVAAGIAVDAGDCVEVSRVEGSRITVRACPPDTNPETTTEVANHIEKTEMVDRDEDSDGLPPNESESILNRTYDEVIEDPFDEDA